MKKQFLTKHSMPRAAIFLSGSGSNAERLLNDIKNSETPTWKPVVLVTDRPKSSRAKELSEMFNIALVSLDIKLFYQERGETRISLFTENGRRIRQEWTDALREKLAPFNIDFGILAGFIPLSNITGDYPCLNVHPGDLTVEVNGARHLVGLHTVPIERAILLGLKTLRSSVIIAQPYTGEGGDMDSGPILGISDEVKIDFQGHTLEELKEIAAGRPERRPIGGYKDLLEEIAEVNQENLKINGDWELFSPVVRDFAKGLYAIDGEQLFYNETPVKTVLFKNSTSTPKIVVK